MLKQRALLIHMSLTFIVVFCLFVKNNQSLGGEALQIRFDVFYDERCVCLCSGFRRYASNSPYEIFEFGVVVFLILFSRLLIMRL
jgi:hypothetical protein